MKKSKLLKVGAVIGIVILGFAGMAALSSTEKESNKRETKPEVRTVNTELIKFGEKTIGIEGSGVVEPLKTLNMVSEATGAVLFAKNNLKDGTFVKEGETLIEIDAREVENTLYSLRSTFMNAVASILPELKVENEEAYSRWNSYFAKLDIHKNLPELPEIKNSQEKMKFSNRDLFSKYYLVKNQELLLSKYIIKAPFDGFIKSNGIIERSYVSKGQHLFTLSDARNLEIAVPLLIEQIDMLDLSGNTSVKIYSGNEKSIYIKGTIVRKEALIDRNSQTLNIYVAFQNNNLNPEFLPGSYLKLEIAGKKFKDVASIPRNLVDNNNNIFVMNEGKLARIPVELIAIQGQHAIIKNTLPKETRLVTTILQRPLVGMSIKSGNESTPSLIPATGEDEKKLSVQK
jgi:membrane fusion protein, multidrug efflux system